MMLCKKNTGIGLPAPRRGRFAVLDPPEVV